MHTNSYKKKPLVSVVMPVYNAEKYLSESVESILTQTFTDFEFICVDDGSLDRSRELLQKFSKQDSRIIVLHNTKNKGVAITRNLGLSIAQGKYVAIQDADDISLPTRLEKQVAYMETSPDVGVLSSAMLVIDESGNRLRKWQVFEDDIILRCFLLCSLPLPNPATIWRKEELQKINGYREGYPPAEDYDALVRAASTCKIANLSDTLVHYRLSSNQLSAQKDLMRSNKVKIQETALETIAGEKNYSSVEIQRMGDLAANFWQELSPDDVLTTADMIWSIMQRCIAKWGGGLEEEKVVRRWLAQRVMRMAGSMLRGRDINIIGQCLPFALKIAPEYKWSREDIWLRIQAVLGPWGARNLTKIINWGIANSLSNTKV